MENIKEILKNTNKLQEFAINRADQLFNALGGMYKYTVSGVDYEEDQITVEFKEITSYYYSETDSITLTILQLEMTENKWMCYIEEKRNETLVNVQNEKDDAEKKKLEAKQKEFDRLKNELGYK